MAVKFNEDYNLTFVYLYGKFDGENNAGEKFNFKRNDSDLALNYKLTDYLKIFLGAKYLSYGIMPAKDNLYSAITYEITGIDSHTSYGPGLGISATIPILNNIFGLATVSGLYLWGKDKFDIKDDRGANQRNLSISYNEYGINTNLSIAYYISDYSTAISLGGRFQYIIADYPGNEIYLSNIKSIIYGVTLTATYTFSIW